MLKLVYVASWSYARIPTDNAMEAAALRKAGLTTPDGGRIGPAFKVAK